MSRPTAAKPNLPLLYFTLLVTQTTLWTMNVTINLTSKKVICSYVKRGEPQYRNKAQPKQRRKAFGAMQSQTDQN